MSGHRFTALLLLLFTACGDDARPQDSGLAGDPAGPVSSTGADPAPTSTTSATSTGGDATPTSTATDPTGTSAVTTGDAPRLDLGVAPDFAAPATGCTKVDLLFVIDNSLSMAAEQDSLIASFPGFITGIQAQLVAADSYHVGIVSTDDYADNPASCRTLGALVTSTGKAQCGPYAAGGGWMSEADDLAASFACAGRVGITGASDERPVAAAIAAIGDPLAAPGACNEGFFRDDALLVITIITDEEDDAEMKNGGSPGDPASWFAAIVARKAGLETNAVVLTVVGGAANNQCPPYSPPQGAEDAPRLRSFAESFTYGSVGDVCADSYDGFFQAAIAAIDTACSNFIPPG